MMKWRYYEVAKANVKYPHFVKLQNLHMELLQLHIPFKLMDTRVMTEYYFNNLIVRKCASFQKNFMTHAEHPEEQLQLINYSHTVYVSMWPRPD